MRRLRSLFAPGTAVLALPSWRAPRLLYAAGDADETAARIALFPATRASARVRRSLLAAASGLRRDVRLAPESSRALGDVLGLGSVQVTAVLLTGRASAEERAVCRLESDGRCIGYAKIAFAPAARSALGRERAILEALVTEVAPRVLGYVESEEFDALALEQCGELPFDAALDPPFGVPSIAPGVGGTEREASQCEWLRGLIAESSLDLARHAEALESRAWPVVPLHGDFAPWNVRTDGSRVRAIDWEFGAVDGLPYVDIAHYVLQREVLLRRRAGSVAADAALARLAEDGRLSDREALALVGLAAAHAHAHALANGDAPDAPHMRAYGDVVERLR